MSPLVSALAGRLLCGPLCLLSCVFAVSARAQTIADYSRAQRAVMENTMSQAAARAAGLAASVPAAGASAPNALPAAVPRPAAREPRWPVPIVSGVFSSPRSVAVEVAVNGVAYLLVPGQGVPGTAWHVESVSAEQAVLRRLGGAEGAGSSEPLRMTYKFAALR